MIKKVVLEKADRLYHIPPVIDEFLPKKPRHKIIRHEILDLARFHWPGPDDNPALDQIAEATPEELAELAEKVAQWYQNRFGTRINPAKELFFNGGIRRILNLFTLTYFNPGDVALIPDPGIWHYRAAISIASAETLPYHLSERNRFKPALDILTGNQARLARAIFINNPHNPTGTSMNIEELSEVLKLAGKNNLIVILDQAFERFGEETNPVSLFAIPGGRKVSFELYSFAYNFGMALPSFSFAVGQPTMISGLRQTARVFGMGINRSQARLAMSAFDLETPRIGKLKARFRSNREMVDSICTKLRLEPGESRPGPFYWVRLPGRKQSRRFCRRLYLRTGIQAVPGIAFGESGEGYIRFSLTGEKEIYQKALDVAGKFFITTREGKSSDG